MGRAASLFSTPGYKVTVWVACCSFLDERHLWNIYLLIPTTFRGILKINPHWLVNVQVKRNTFRSILNIVNSWSSSKAKRCGWKLQMKLRKCKVLFPRSRMNREAQHYQVLILTVNRAKCINQDKAQTNTRSSEYTQIKYTLTNATSLKGFVLFLPPLMM